jgi:hypothetical protein
MWFFPIEIQHFSESVGYQTILFEFQLFLNKIICFQTILLEIK